jgi:GNAT superfamily N-acetyltransferase
MGGNDRHDTHRAVGTAGQWLGMVRPLMPADTASLSFKSYAPAWSPGAVALGYFLGGQLRGVAHLLPLNRISQTRAEIRIAVDEEWRRCGIGTLLMEALLQQARLLGVEDLYFRCHALNEPLQLLAERFGAEIGFEDCQAYGRIRLAAPACVSEAR